MRDFGAALSRFAASARSDLLLAFISGVVVFGFLIATALNGDQHWVSLIFFGPYCTALAIRRRWPLAAAVLAGAAFLSVRPLGQSGIVDGHLTVALAWTPFLIGYALGAYAGLWAGLAGVLLLAVGLQAENAVFNPVFEMITFGPWLAGRIAASRTRLTRQLEVRNAELAAEQERFAAESVRLERARVARELHDIVAHCLAVIV